MRETIFYTFKTRLILIITFCYFEENAILLINYLNVINNVQNKFNFALRLVNYP